MLKIKDNVNFEKIIDKYNLNYEADSDYESGWCYASYDDGNIFFDVSDNKNVFIYGQDNTNLELLYDLIKADLVEKVDD